MYIDICYFLLGLLSEKEKMEITDECWFEFVKNTFAGINNDSLAVNAYEVYQFVKKNEDRIHKLLKEKA